MTPYQRKCMYCRILLKAYELHNSDKKFTLCGLIETDGTEMSKDINDYPELVASKPSILSKTGWFPSWNTYARIRLLERIIVTMKLPYFKEMYLSFQYGRKIAGEQCS